MRRGFTTAVVTLCLLAMALLVAPPVGASTVPTTGITLVHVSSPHAPRNLLLKTNKTWPGSSNIFAPDHIGVLRPPTGPRGGTPLTHDTAEVTYKTGHKLLLNTFECKGAITGNLTGNVKAFIKYLNSLVG